MDVTPDHLVHDFVRNITEHLTTGEEPLTPIFLDRAQPITPTEHSEVTVAALTLCVVAMLEAVDVSRAGAEVNIDEMLTRCSLRVLGVK